MANLSRYEQETIINFNAADDTAELYTADPVWMRKLDKLAEQNPGQFKVGRSERCEGTVIAKRYLFPKKLITVRSKVVKRDLTDEQREKLSERMKEMHQNQF